MRMMKFALGKEKEKKNWLRVGESTALKEGGAWGLDEWSVWNYLQRLVAMGLKEVLLVNTHILEA